MLGRDDVISLGVGEPDFATPWHIREAAIFSLEKGHDQLHVEPRADLAAAKRSRSTSSAVLRRRAYDPASEVLVTVGVSEALDLALRALLNPGDEVLYHEPCYVSYSPSIVVAHGERPGACRREARTASR